VQRAWLGHPLVQCLFHLRGEHVLPGAGLDVGGDWVEVQHVVQEAIGERVPTHDVRCDELPMPRQVQHLVLIQDEIALQCQAGDGLTDRRCADLKSLDQPGSSWWHTGLVQLEHCPQVHLQRLGMLGGATAGSVRSVAVCAGYRVGRSERHLPGTVHPASVHRAGRPCG